MKNYAFYPRRVDPNQAMIIRAVSSSSAVHQQQIQFAPSLGITPSTRAEEPHLVRLHSLEQSHGNFALCTMIKHWPKTATRPTAKQASPKA